MPRWTPTGLSVTSRFRLERRDLDRRELHRVEPADRRADDRAKTLLEHDRLISALAARDRARCAAELEHHRYSAEDGLPIELPGVGDDLPGVTN